MKRVTFDLENIPPAHESPIHQPCDDNRAKKKQKLDVKPASEGKLWETGRINCEELLSMPIRNVIQIGNIKATKRHIVHQLRKRADENELLSNGCMEKRFRDIWFEKLVQEVDREFPDMPKGFREDLHPFWQALGKGSSEQLQSLLVEFEKTFTEDQGDQEIPSKPKIYCKGNPCDNITAIKFLLAVELRQGASDFEELSDETIKQKIEEFGDGTVDEFVEFCCPSTRNYKCSVPLGKTTFMSTECTGEVPSEDSVLGNQCKACRKIRDEVHKKLHVAMLIANAKRSIWSGSLHIDQHEISKYPEASEAVFGELAKQTRALKQKRVSN